VPAGRIVLLTRARPSRTPAVRGDVTRRAGQADGIVRAVDTPDAALTARLAAGDEEALAEVWDRYGPLVYGHARRLTRDASLAQDVAQEVFVTLWQHPDRFDASRGSLRAYLGVHAHRRAIDAVRRDVRRTEREQRHHRLHPEGAWAPGDSAEAASLAEAVRQAIVRLPAEQREAVELAYFGGLTHRELAAALKIPEGTVKSRLRLAQAKLQSWLDPRLLELV
jgi:RNA polymerase sigma-70 factor (ECF subfamily)